MVDKGGNGVPKLTLAVGTAFPDGNSIAGLFNITV